MRLEAAINKSPATSKLQFQRSMRTDESSNHGLTDENTSTSTSTSYIAPWDARRPSHTHNAARVRIGLASPLASVSVSSRGRRPPPARGPRLARSRTRSSRRGPRVLRARRTISGAHPRVTRPPRGRNHGARLGRRRRRRRESERRRRRLRAVPAPANPADPSPRVADDLRPPSPQFPQPPARVSSDWARL